MNRQFARQPRKLVAWIARTDFLARRRLWSDAILDIRQALELHPPGTWKEGHKDTLLGMRASAVLLEAGDLDGYRRLARALLDRLAGSNSPMFLERTIKVNLLAPPPPKNLARLTAMANRSVKIAESSEWLPSFQLARGVASYRAGEFAETVRWLRLPLKANMDGTLTPTIRLHLAMSGHRLGHAEQVRSLLAEARQPFDGWRVTRADWGES